MTRWLRHLRAAARRPRLDDDLAAELEQHVAWRTKALIDEGVEPVEARRRALVAFGNVTRLREEARRMWGFPTVDSLAQDVQYGVRLLRRSPMFSAIAILSLAIGIGAGAAVFSLADTLLFRKLAVRDPDSLVVLRWVSGPAFPYRFLNGYADETDQQIVSTSFSSDAVERFSRETASRLDVFGFADIGQVSLSTEAGSDTGTAATVSGNYFDVLGLTATLGRPLTTSDDRESAAPAAIISARCWRRAFGAASDVVGKRLTVNAVPFTVVGVAPMAFHGTGQAGTDPDVYVPIAMRRRILPTGNPPTDPNFWWILVMGRLKPGVEVAEARNALDLLLKRSVSEARPDLAPKDRPRIELLPGARGQNEDRQQMRPAIVTMAIVTAIVLLVACANVANLLLARGSARVREFSVRVAIGAPRWRLVWQLLTEAMLLAIAGCALGIVVARWMGAALVPALQVGPGAVIASTGVDGRLLAFAALVACVSAVAFGLVPALRSTDVQLHGSLHEIGRGTAHARQKRLLSGALVVAQIALSLLLATTAGLLVRSLRNLQHVPLGFDADNVLLFRLDPSASGYEASRIPRFYADLLERLRQMPGVRAASVSTHGLMTNTSTFGAVSRMDEAPPPRGSAEAMAFVETHGALQLAVDPQFFATLGIPMRRGTAFGASRAPALVAVINRAMALRLFKTDDVVGRRIRLGSASTAEIIGVCGDAIYTSLRNPDAPIAYFDYRQRAPSKVSLTFEVKTAGPAQSIAPAVRELIRTLDPSLPLFGVTTQQEQIGRSLEREHLFAALSTLLGTVALLLSALGLYGLLSYSVVRRTAEIGVRMALGAGAGAVRWMVLRESMVLAAIGLALGIPAALAGTRLLEALLYGLPPRDVGTLAGAATTLLVVALLAGYIPARRAARVDPIVALRG